MSGKWANSNRRDQLPDDWHRIRKQALDRDNQRCTTCGQPATDVDHIDSPNDHNLHNLRSLCARCHRHHTQQQAQQALQARRARARLPIEQHPGLLP